jgi:hypothetical protein
MRNFISSNNLYTMKDMNANHPVKLGFEDKTADEVLNKVLLFVAAFCSTIIMSIVFGFMNCFLILAVAGLAYYFSFMKDKKQETEYEETTDYTSLDDISAIENCDKCNDDSDRLTPKFDLSTEYTLFSL